MRIIHTADWHLCDRLKRIDRTGDLAVRVERVAALCEEHKADVLLIAGDLFAEEATVEDMTPALNHMRDVFEPFFSRGGTILAITGNHDRDVRINMVRSGMQLAAPGLRPDKPLPGGRMYLFNGRVVCSLVGKAGQQVQFVLVPYPVPSRYDLSGTAYRTIEEQNRLLHGKVSEWLLAAPRLAHFRKDLPTLLVGHLHVRGSEIHTLYKLTERDDVRFDIADLNPDWAYVALGHVHKPQALLGQTNVRYSGSLDRLDFGETHDDHGVCLLEVGRTGLNSEPTRLNMAATRFHSITLNDAAAELPTLAERFPDRDTAIVRVLVQPQTAGPGRDETTRVLRSLFPRLCELTWAPSANGSSGASGTLGAHFVPNVGFSTRVRDYLKDKLTNHPDKDAILALAESFLSDGDE